MKVLRVQIFMLLWISLTLSACNESKPKPKPIVHKITVTTVEPKKAITVAQQYVCRIQSHHRIEVRAPEAGILGVVRVKEGQTVQQGDLLFQLRPTIGKEQREGENGYQLVSITAPFDGTIERLPFAQDSFVQTGETLTNLADNSLMWAYFNVPEARYLEYKAANLEQHTDDLKFELLLTNGDKFDQPGKFGAIGADFNSGTGSVPFRADFANPNHSLRHGQPGTLVITRAQSNVLVIPQRATFEVLGKRYVYVVDKDDVAHQREIAIQNELDDIFVIQKGLDAGDKIVVEGVRRIHDGEKVKYEDHQLKNVAVNLN